MADGDAGQVAVVEVVVGLSKERYEREAAGTAVSFGLAHGCVGPHIRRSEHCEVVGLAAEPAVVLTVQLHTSQGVDVVLTSLEAVAGHGVPHPLRPVLLLGLDSIGGVGHGAFGDRIGEDALLLLSVVETEGALDVEVLEGVDVDEGIAEHAPVCVAIVCIARKACQRVFAVGIAADGTCEAAIGSIDGQRGIELKDVLEESARSLHLAGAVDGEVLAYGDDVAVVNLQELVVAVHAGREAAEIGVLDDAEVLVVAEREEAAAFLRTVAQRDIIFLHDARARGLVEPVGVGSGSGAGGVEVLAHRDAVEHRHALLVVGPVVVIAEAVHVGVETIVDVALPHHLPELLGIEHLHAVGISLYGHAGVEVDLHLAFLATLGGDDDDAVSCTATVDRS